ncbi:MAG: hypothetical protein IJ708_12350, partial [Clostridia bacterium]|nr:hypothetical protein [Clostridia bacterium]MBR2288069.1 hypothetical protein [Clostridia bacterium]
MKRLNRFAGVLKVIGIVLLCLAVVFWLYALANTGKPWNTLNAALTINGVDTAFTDRVLFDDSYFSALSNASSSRTLEESERLSQVRGYFSRWFAQMEAAESAAQDALVSSAVTYLGEEMDVAAFLEKLE